MLLATIPNYYNGYKQVALSPDADIRNFIRHDHDKNTTIQEIYYRDFIVAMDIKSNQLKVYYNLSGGKTTPVVSKKVYAPVLSAVNRIPELKNWFNNSEVFIPDGFMWTVQDLMDEPIPVAKFYNLNLFLPELDKKQLAEIVFQFELIPKHKQVATVNDTSMLYKESTPYIPYKTASEKQVRKMFSCLPKDYVEFLIENNLGKKPGTVNAKPNSVNWSYAKRIPANLTVNALYQDGELIRFNDLITIDKDGNAGLYSIHTVEQNRLEPEHNLSIYSPILNDDVVKVIYVLHRVNKEGGINSNWFLFKKR